MRKEDDEELDGEGGLKRSNRNLNEKKRRDRFNILLSQLAGIVSNKNEPRKLDKTTVLRQAINFLENHQSHVRTRPDTSRFSATWQPSFTTDGEFNLIVLEALDSFVLSLDNDGHIMFASQSVLPLLGYLPDELQGTSLVKYMDDRDASRIWPEMRLALERENTGGDSKNSFHFQMLCGNHYSKISRKVVNCETTVISNNDFNQSEQRNSKVIIVVGKVLHPPQPDRVVITADCQDNQFSYRLTMDWKYVHVDHRASSIIGFLPFEVLGTSFYEYCCDEELFNIAQYHRILIHLGKVTTCYFRHLTKGQSWVWLRSSCYISYNQWNSKPESISGTATVVSFEEVCAEQSKLLKHDREYFNRVVPARKGGDPLSSICSWPSSPVNEKNETMQHEVRLEESDDAVEVTSYEQKETKKSFFMPHDVLKSLMTTPSDQLLEIISTHSDLHFESDDEQTDNHLRWLENIKIPSGLSRMQLTRHLKLLEEYRKIAEQIRKQEKQLKLIRKLIEWGNLLLEVDSNIGVVGESSADSEASSMSNLS